MLKHVRENREEKKNENVNQLLKIFSNHGVDVLVDVAKERCMINILHYCKKTWIFLYQKASLQKIVVLHG